jgi:hypothetical protein
VTSFIAYWISDAFKYVWLEKSCFGESIQIGSVLMS